MKKLVGELLGGLLATVVLLAAPASAQQGVRTIAITAPASEETVHSNTGDVNVTLHVAPRLASGEQIALALDDREVARGARTRIRLTGVDRGTHLLQAKLLDADGNTLAQSDVVTFYMWHASKLFPDRKKP